MRLTVYVILVLVGCGMHAGATGRRVASPEASMWAGAVSPDEVVPCHTVSVSDVAAFSAHLKAQPQCEIWEDVKEALVFFCGKGPTFVGAVFADSEDHCSGRLKAVRAATKSKAR